jgi:myo-inositol-1(or 4)-monophosphatase
MMRLVDLAKQAVTRGFPHLSNTIRQETAAEFYVPGTREIKANIDQTIEAQILKLLEPTGISILSEEQGQLNKQSTSEYQFIVDPLDGTVNFIRQLGPSAISVALWKGDSPIFGVLKVFPTGELCWGGPTFGAFINDEPISVSSRTDPQRCTLCTGIPSRYQFDPSSFSDVFKRFERFSKIRMYGSAAFSLLQVARGAADIYIEDDIMLWDVAAGLAILQGAGGDFSAEPGSNLNSRNVIANNDLISI